jgi:DNA-binding LacI/PurR family transcriptional regulator
MKTTIYDVAKAAGVSIATVSKVINNNGRISQETRKKVRSIMVELDYQPSGVAVALTGKQTYTIGVLVPDISNPFFSEIAKVLENSARDAGYALIICSTYHQEDRENMYLDLLLKKQVDGFIIATEPKDIDSYAKLNKRNIPTVLFTIDSMLLSSHVVTTDDVRGGFLAGKYLVRKGHRKIAVILEEGRKSSLTRLEGFKEALNEKGITLNQNDLYEAKSSMKEARHVARSLLLSSYRPSAVFCCTDLIAIALINEARKLGLAVPQDLSVIGYDNTVLAELSDPELTTIEQPLAELVKATMTLLITSISEPESESQRKVFKPELKERHSVRFLENSLEY